MNEQILIPVVLGYAGCIAVLFSILPRAKKIVANAGECKLSLRRDGLLKVLFLFVVCFSLITIIFLNRLPRIGNYVICAVGVLACELGVRNLLVKKFGGVYEHGIFLQYPFIAFDNIESIPVLGWEDKEKILENQTSLQVVLKDGTNISLLFESTLEMEKIIKLILELCPKLGNV